MTTIEIKDASGKKAGTADLAASVFGIEPNVPVMHQVVMSKVNRAYPPLWLPANWPLTHSLVTKSLPSK